MPGRRPVGGRRGARARSSMTSMSAPRRPARVPGRDRSDGLGRDPRLRLLADESGYEIHGRIGAGGMGIVYRAQDADGRDVAVKLLRPEIADDPRARERLAREVAAQQRVRHHNIARIVDAELDSSEAFVVTEFVPGPTLEDAVRDHDGLHPEAVREIGLVLGETLRDIHAAGVVHRDLKPSNVLLRDARESDLVTFDPDGAGLDPVIIDFGIAQAAEESRLTSAGLVMGTAAYLDPEVVRTNATGASSDWWSWAALLAFAATGREPFGSGRADLVFFRAERGELDVDGLPADLAAWLRDALRADPARRPEPAELLRRLELLDLQRVGGPDGGAGETKVLAAGGATEAFATGGGAEATAAHPRPDDARDDDGPSGGSRTEALPRIGETTETIPRIGEATETLPAVDGVPGAGGLTEVLPVAGPTRAVPLSGAEATEALPLGGASRGEWSAEATAALPRVEDDRPGASGAPGSSAVGRWDERPEPATEVMEPVRAETRVMPVIRDDQAPPHRPALDASRRHPEVPPQGAPYAYPPQPRPQAPMQQHAGPGAQQAAPYGYGPGGQALPVPAYGLPEARARRRPLLVWLGHAILIALAVVAPYISLALVMVLGALARTWERSHRSLESARRRGGGAGARTRVSWGVGIAAPFRFLLGLLELVLTVVFPLLLGVLLAVCTDAVLHYGMGTEMPSGALFGIVMTVTILLTWVGIGSATTRSGAHRLLDAAAPDRVWGLVIGALLALLLAAVIATALARGGLVDYFPFVTWPRFDELLPWRS